MSQTYVDLTLTNFPESVDDFLTFLNITAADGPLIMQYQQAMELGNISLANQILEQIPAGTQKVITSATLNKLTEAIQAVERFYSTDIQPYVDNLQKTWLTTIQQFEYKGAWSGSESYVENNLVTYSVSGLTLVYLAIGNPPIGTPPSNTSYWQILTLQGQPGPSGEGLSYRQTWSSSTPYYTNDAVTYNGNLYMALQDSQNQDPETATDYWKLVMTLGSTVYPIQADEPVGQEVGMLWFNTQSNPTKYYYLAPLTNPADAGQIVYGREAYDGEGNIITGSLSVPYSLAVTTNPTTMSYNIGQTFNPAGMVVTLTYTNGEQVSVTSYTYAPTGELTVDDTTITISYTELGVTVETTLSITNNDNPIYGVEWDGTSTTLWTRTDASAGFVDPQPAVNNGTGSSPFDNLMPWSGMQKVDDPVVGTLVSIPKFYYKLTQNGNGLKLQISPEQQDGFYVSPAHMDRGDGVGERDVVYIGRYKCASDYKSKTGVLPVGNITRSTARTNIHNLGAEYYQNDIQLRITIWMLYLVEFANWNSQAMIGYGCGDDSAVGNMGYTDAMQYHTGTTQVNRTTYGLGTQYRWIEGLWDNTYDWIDGCYYNNNGLNLILNPNNFSDSSGGTSVGTPSGGWSSAFNVATAGGFPMFYPTAASGSGSTYSCDHWVFYSSYPCLYVGGDYDQNVFYGLFYVQCNGVSGANNRLSTRLQKLPS